MPAKKLDSAEIQALMVKAKGWSVVNGKLHRAFECKDFVSSFGNMTRVALIAESMNHHPEWFIWAPAPSVMPEDSSERSFCRRLSAGMLCGWRWDCGTARGLQPF